MKDYQLQILKTVIVILGLLGIKLIIHGFINRIFISLQIAPERKRIISKIINFFLTVLGVVLLTAIWGVSSQQFTVFITTSLTILGVAFFAQWSILSNLTSSLILFFNHPIRIGGCIKILDKDYPIEGVVEKLSMFFLYIRTSDNRLITIPNTVALNKIISIDMDEERKQIITKKATS